MWKVEYKKRFLKELSKIPESVQAQAEKIVFEDLIVNIRLTHHSKLSVNEIFAWRSFISSFFRTKQAE